MIMPERDATTQSATLDDATRDDATLDDATVEVAAEFRIILGSLVRRLRQHRATDDPSAPETAVLARLEREGPATAAQLARRENVSPQSMGVTVSGLQGRGFVSRATDPEDGRRIVLALTDAGAGALRGRRSQRTHAIAEAMGQVLNDDEIAQLRDVMPLLDRLADAL